jgi:hypothetical protein
MRAGSRAKSRTALLVCVGVIAAAPVFVLLTRPQTPPPAPGTEHASAVLRGDSTAAEGAVDGATSLPTERTTVESGTALLRTEEATAIVLEVRDSAGRLVPGVGVSVRNDEDQVLFGQSATDGTLQLPQGVTADVMVDWRAVVTLPGRVVSQPMRLSRPGVVTIGIGHVGTLRITCEGVGGGRQPLVTEFRDGEPRGPTSRGTTTPSAADVSVAAGGLQYRVTGYGRLGDGRLVVGPRGQGDVVELHLDLRPCRVTGQLVYGGPPGEGGLFALLIAAYETKSYLAELQADGHFAVDLPKVRYESIVFVQGALYGAFPPVTLDADERDVGPIRMGVRPRLGRLEVRNAQGEMQYERPGLVHFTTAAGTRVNCRLDHGPFFLWRAAQDASMECFGIPAITEVAVSPGRVGWFAEPRVVVMRDDGVFRANLVEGGRVGVLLSAPGMVGLHDVWLEEGATKDPIARKMARFQDPAAGLQLHVFRDVPPGRYQVRVRGIEIVGGSNVARPSCRDATKGLVAGLVPDRCVRCTAPRHYGRTETAIS